MKHPKSLPVVIVGGGFAGVTLAQHLEKTLDPSVEIVVISRDNHLVFTPMLAEVAGRSVSPMHVVVAGRQTTKRIRWIAAVVTGVDLAGKSIRFKQNSGESQSLAFGDLIIACGMAVNLGEIPGMEAHALPLKSIDDAFVLGNILVERFEEAAVEPNAELQSSLLTTVVLGGGFSGVEIAGHLHDLARNMLRYYNFASGVVPRTIILQRGARIIPELQHDRLSEFALKKLRQNGVEVYLKTEVKEISRTQVHVGGGEKFSYGMLVGTVGNTASAFVRESGLPLERNRLATDGAMRVVGQTNIWAIGDCAYIQNAFDGKPSPPTAQFALRQAKQVAQNIVRSRQNLQLAAFSFRPQGLLASIGRQNGVAEIYGIQFLGFVAWVLWRAVYLMKMPSFARKFGIAVDWFMDALFGENAVRVGNRSGATLRKEHYVAGDVIYRQGQPSTTLYFIEKGMAGVYLDGVGEAVSRLTQGEHFGLSAVEESETAHTTTVVAESAIDVVAVDRDGLKEMSRDGLTRELVRLLELRRIRQSWQNVLEQFPAVDKLTVSDVMIREPAFLHTSDTLMTACERLVSTVCLPVVDGDRSLVGTCTREDVGLALARGLAGDSEASAFISKTVTTLSPQDALQSATVIYLRSGQDLVPVVNDRKQLMGTFGLMEAALKVRETKGK